MTHTGRNRLPWPVAAGLLLAACTSATREAETANGPTLELVPEDATDFQAEATVEPDGTITHRRVVLGGWTVATDFDWSKLPKKPAAPAIVREKIGALLAARLRPSAPDATTEVVVAVAHDAPFTRLPSLRRDLPRDSAVNTRLLAAREALFSAVDARRKPFRNAVIARAQALGAVVTEELPMGNGVVMTIPDRAVSALAAHEYVVSIAPRYEGTPPPAESKISDGTSLATGMNSDFWRPFADGSLPSFRVALLDTGVRSSHTVFTAADAGVLGMHRDCVNTTDANCLNTGNPAYNDQDPTWNHGTGAANVLIGGNSSVSGFGLPFRGVSHATLDYINVYNSSMHDLAAVSRAFNVAKSFTDDLIVAELQIPDGDASPASLAADDAFDNGIAVIAAVGNKNAINHPAAPGNAHKALAVGDYDAVTGVTISQIAEAMPDGRPKPDFQAPTSISVAGRANDQAINFVFDGTSGATAFAGGAAALMYKWLNMGWGMTNKPGNLYATLIAQGDGGTWPTGSAGAGKLKLKGGSEWTSGQITLGTSTINLTWNIPASRKDLRVAIWWPERQSDAHDDIDLNILNGSGVGVGYSGSTNGVWEKVSVDGNLPQGTYILQVIPYHMPRTTQVVYYTATTSYQ
jgi:hypothetical protein